MATRSSGKFELQLNQQNIKPGAYTFFMRGETKRKYVRNPEAIPAIEAEQKATTELLAQAGRGGEDGNDRQGRRDQGGAGHGCCREDCGAEEGRSCE